MLLHAATAIGLSLLKSLGMSFAKIGCSSSPPWGCGGVVSVVFPVRNGGEREKWRPLPLRI